MLFFSKYCLDRTKYCLVSAVGADCTGAGGECDIVSNTQCGDNDKCVCRMGYVGSIGDDYCKSGKTSYSFVAYIHRQGINDFLLLSWTKIFFQTEAPSKDKNMISMSHVFYLFIYLFI